MHDCYLNQRKSLKTSTWWRLGCPAPSRYRMVKAPPMRVRSTTRQSTAGSTPISPSDRRGFCAPSLILAVSWHATELTLLMDFWGCGQAVWTWTGVYYQRGSVQKKLVNLHVCACVCCSWCSLCSSLRLDCRNVWARECMQMWWTGMTAFKIIENWELH